MEHIVWIVLNDLMRQEKLRKENLLLTTVFKVVTVNFIALKTKK